MKIKGICHVHSSYSHDGEVSLADLKDYFKQKGFQFLLLTEHINDVSGDIIRQIVEECQSLSDKEFIIIPGLEIKDGKEHFLIIGIDGSQNEVEELIRGQLSSKMVIWAHPFFMGTPRQDRAMNNPIDGMEIWNSVYDGKSFPRWQALKLLDKLRQGKDFYGLGGIDFHRFSHAGGPYLTLEVQNFSQEEILKKLKAGQFTLQKNNLVVGSDGSISGADKLKVKLMSPFICWFLKCIRIFSRILFILKISPPKKTKELIRSKI
jgi:hypothetical protein